MTLARTILHGLAWGLAAGVGLAIGATAVIWFAPTWAAGDAPGAWSVEGPYRQTVFEMAVLGPYLGNTSPVLAAFDGARPMGVFTWGNPATYWCGVDLDCGDGAQPAPVPLPASVWFLIAAIAALIWKGRTNALS